MKYTDLLDKNKVSAFNYGLSLEKPVFLRFHTYEDKASIGFDMHYDLEIGIVCSGRMIRKYHTHEAILEPGQIWLGGIWEPHGFYLDQVPCRVAAAMISPEFMINMEQIGFRWMTLFSIPPEQRPQIAEKNRPEILEICKKLEMIAGSERKQDLLLKKNLLIQVLIFLIEDAADSLHEDRQPELKGYTGIQPAIQMVFSTKRYIPLVEAARACALSTSHFSKVFKDLMGIPFSRFALRYRVKEAAQQLLFTNDSIKAIAVDWGFIDTSHFNSCFKSHFSLSPKQYRKIYR